MADYQYDHPHRVVLDLQVEDRFAADRLFHLLNSAKLHAMTARKNAEIELGCYAAMSPAEKAACKVSTAADMDLMTRLVEALQIVKVAADDGYKSCRHENARNGAYNCPDCGVGPL